MKNIKQLIILFLLLISIIANAQQQVSEIEAKNATINTLHKDTTTTNKNIEREKKTSYSFFIEYGLGAGIFFNGNPYVETTRVFVNSIKKKKKQDMIGIGIGCDSYYLVLVQAFPIFVNYRHNFSSKTNLKPLINVALGTRISVWGECGLYSTIAGGFRYKSLSFNAGISIKSLNKGNESGEVEVKLGYIFLK
jgi:H+/Cl- antiporter ClcA